MARRESQPHQVEQIGKIDKQEIQQHNDALSFIAEQDRIVNSMLGGEERVQSLDHELFGPEVIRCFDERYIKIMDLLRPHMVQTNGEESEADQIMNRAILDLRSLLLSREKDTMELSSDRLSLEDAVLAEAGKQHEARLIGYGEAPFWKKFSKTVRAYKTALTEEERMFDARFKDEAVRKRARTELAAELAKRLKAI